MPERIYTMLDAGVGSRLRIAKKTDKREGTLIGYRFAKRSRGLWLHIQFEDGKVEEYWRPKEVTLLEKSPVYCSWDTGRWWQAFGKRFEPETLIGNLFRRQKMTDELDTRGNNIYVEVGFDFCRPPPDGDNSKKVYEGPFPLFRTALEKLMEKPNVRPANHAQELVEV